jgi:hypothetical protein
MEPVASPLVGFRAWKVKDDLLTPCWQSSNTWETVTAHAVCRAPYCMPTWSRPPHVEPRHKDAAPNGSCTCGIHGYYAADPNLNGAREPRGCWGMIVAWGKIIECERGFKAQHARIVALLEEPEPAVDLTAILDRYQIPLLPLDELEQYGHFWGEIHPLNAAKTQHGNA